MQKYLPSRQFIVRLIVIAIIVLIVFGLYELFNFIKNRRVNSGAQPVKILIKDAVQKDTNKNGIPDWEEALWGLDPTKDGEKNKATIIAKRVELAKSNDDYIIEGNTPSKANEDLSKEFFAVIMSLQQNGNLDNASIQAVSKAVGEKIVAEPIPDPYTGDMLNVKPTNDKTVSTYIESFKKINDKYADKDIGNELTFIAQGLKNNDPQAISVVGDVAQAYISFGRELIKVPVPDSIAPYNLALANDYEKVGQSILGMMSLLDDPIIGMKSLINYKKYNDELVSNIETISDNLE